MVFDLNYSDSDDSDDSGDSEPAEFEADQAPVGAQAVPPAFESEGGPIDGAQAVLSAVEPEGGPIDGAQAVLSAVEPEGGPVYGAPESPSRQPLLPDVAQAVPPAVEPEEAEPSGADAEHVVAAVHLQAAPAAARAPKRKPTRQRATQRKRSSTSAGFVCKIPNGTEIDLLSSDDDGGTAAAAELDATAAAPVAVAAAAAAQCAVAVAGAAGSSTASAAVKESSDQLAAGVPPAAASPAAASPAAASPAGNGKAKMPGGKPAFARGAAPRASQRNRGVRGGQSAASPPLSTEERREKKRETAARHEQATADAAKAWKLSGARRSGGGVAVMVESDDEGPAEVKLKDPLEELLVVLRDPCCIVDDKEGLIEIVLQQAEPSASASSSSSSSSSAPVPVEAGCVWHERISAKSSREMLCGTSGGKKLDANLFVSLLEKDRAFAIPVETASKHWHLGELETALDDNGGSLSP